MMRLVVLVIFTFGMLAMCADGCEMGSANQREAALLQQRLTINVKDTPIYELVQSLRAEHHVPISFIEAKIDTNKSSVLNLDLNNSTVSDLLNQVVADLPAYCWEEIEGRLVLYPNAAKYKLQVHVKGITNMKRIEAVDEYLSQLRAQQAEFADLLNPAIKGDDTAPLYSEPVSLRESGAVLQHFVELLGNDPKVVFSIVATKAGPPMYVLDRIQ
jgi:hypothetical protein